LAARKKRRSSWNFYCFTVLQVVNRAISSFLIKQAGLKRPQAATGAVTLIQRFGSAANLNIHLHCLVLDGVSALPRA
jgi:pyruvate/oxaloacetate carboxyltransferase